MGALANTLIGFSIALLPLYTKIAAMDISRLSKDNLLVVLMMVFCFILPSKRRSLSKIGLIAGAYALVSLFLNQWNPLSIMVQYQTFYIAVGLMFFACFYERFVFHKLDHILNGMAVGCVIQSIIVICTHFGFPVYFEALVLLDGSIEKVGESIDGLGSLGNSNLLAAYVSLTLISLFRKKWFYFLPLPLLALFYAHSVMGYATAFAAVFYFINSKHKLIKKHLLYLASSISMIAAYLHGVWGEDSKRFYIWSENFKKVDLSHFVFGRGPGWYSDHGILIPGYRIATQEHNEFIALFNFFGIIGAAIFVGVFAKFLFSRDVNKYFASILFAGFCNSYGHFVLHQSTTALILIVSAAICLAERGEYVVKLER